MGVAVKPPGPLMAPLIEWRARQIGDPVERLRFLRTATTRVSQPPINTTTWKRWRWSALVPIVLWAWLFVPVPIPSTVRPTSAPAQGLNRSNAEDKPAGPVWLVEENTGFEIYSNGLRVEKEFVTSNRTRTSYGVFRQVADTPISQNETIGIVFHSTESHQAPFEPSETRHLKRIGRYLIEYIRQNHSYHYVIDRFGRVFRIVRESDVANHAGKSVWGDAKGTYIMLNDSFLGVAVEAQTDLTPATNTAQVHALRVLTEMLRTKYTIPSNNCVTHAQVSVNPSNGQIGYHTDWAYGFPFTDIGLPDNYKLKLASVTAFGFVYESSFLSTSGDRRWPGLIASLEEVNQQAGAAGVPAADYRKRLQQRFQNILNSAPMRERGEEQ